MGLACSTFVPLNKTSFLCALSTSILSEVSNSWIDSLRSGVDSPDSMASLTIHVPWIKRMSAGTTVSDCKRAGRIAVRYETREIDGAHLPTETTSPGSSSSVCKVVHLESRRHWIGYGATAMVLNSVSVLTRCTMTVSTNEGAHLRRRTCQTTVHSNMTSMKRVKML